MQFIEWSNCKTELVSSDFIGLQLSLRCLNIIYFYCDFIDNHTAFVSVIYWFFFYFFTINKLNNGYFLFFFFSFNFIVWVNQKTSRIKMTQTTMNFKCCCRIGFFYLNVTIFYNIYWEWKFFIVINKNEGKLMSCMIWYGLNTFKVLNDALLLQHLLH